MIKEIRYKNFKALRDATLPLGRFTLIVGANGTGKTTAIEALNIARNPSKTFFEDICSVDFANHPNSSVDLIIVTENGEMKVKWEDELDENFKQKVKTKFSDSKTSNLITEDSESTLRQNIINEILEFKVFSFNSDSITKPVAIQAGVQLDTDGTNLTGILDQLRDSDPEKFEELNNELNRWFPEFDRILFEVPDEGKKTFLLRTKFGKHKIKAKDLSDGTRLALAYLTLAYLPNPPKIVAFEEPEKGIHPRLLKNIQEAMYRLAYPENYGEKREPVQVIATTHSPYLLDLYKDYPEEIVIASKDENGVHFERLIDQPHYEEVIQDAPLGEVWYTGVLGGVPVQP